MEALKVMQPQKATALNPAFAKARIAFENLLGELASPEVRSWDHRALEVAIEAGGREVMRSLYQDSLDLRGPGAVDGPVEGADGVIRTHVRPGTRPLVSIFGPVVAKRLGYGARGAGSLFPADGELNLPLDKYSFGLRERLGEEAAKTSFEDAIDAVRKATGVELPKRQAEELVRQAATDFDSFYSGRAATCPVDRSQTSGILVMSADGKGIVMRTEDLREATRKAAEGRTNKLSKRLSRGEKRNAKRMTTVAAVYTIEPQIRTTEDVIKELRPVQAVEPKKRKPQPEQKRVWASVATEPEDVIREAFEEAIRRDPGRTKTWMAVVDGNKTQLMLFRKYAREYGVNLTIVLDFIHVSEYLWKSATAFHKEGTPEAQAWVTSRLAHILDGHSSNVAAGIRRSATLQKLSESQRKAVDSCANYLLNNAEYLHYDAYLKAGLPIASGVIEGACRHLVKDRMDVTGARWSLDGAEAVLRLRSLRSSGDLEEYWSYHAAKELERNHTARYADGVPPTRRPPPFESASRARLQVVR